MKQNFIAESLKSISPKEWTLYVFSLTAITLSFCLSPQKDYLTLISSLLGISGVFFVGKGLVLGQFFFVIFSVFYGLVAIKFRYYSEIITYFGMNTPISIAAIVTWLKHPYKDSAEVEVAHVTPKILSITGILTAIVTTAFYFILKALGTANLPVSTVSIATSFTALCFELIRSSYYALAFMCNDIVLIALWAYAAFQDTSFFPMVVCFVIFLLNDSYGFWNWQRMKHAQKSCTK